MAPLNEIRFVKGHGTGNDFIVIPDLDGKLDLSDGDVRYLCDRKFGIGADGILRVVRTEHMAEADDVLRAGEFFMDYRNADGSRAEMCGNGARVFIRYLDAVGLITDADVTFATRGGLREATMHSDHSVTVDMGVPSVPKVKAAPIVVVDDRSWPAVGVFIPNPHAVVFVDSLDDAGSLRESPNVAPAEVFPDGVNVEFVVDRGPGHVAMRVHERGVGETLSCGTGACAVAWAAARRDRNARAATTQVDVPGGTVFVTETDDGRMLLRGPADLVARGTVLLPV